MNNEKSALIKSFKIMFSRLLKGKAHFLTKNIGDTLVLTDKRRFKVFRNLKVDKVKNPENDFTVSEVLFKFSSLSLTLNKYLSMIPIPFLIAKEGFLQKIWTISEDGYFMGIYQWSSFEHAKNYPESFIYNMLSRRAQKGTMKYNILPNSCIIEYVKDKTI